MAKFCQNCGKGAQTGSARAAHSKVRTKRRFELNLHQVRVKAGNVTQRIMVCTSCLKKIKSQAKLAKPLPRT